MKTRVTIWNEFVHEQNDEKVKALYPKGIHGAIKDLLQVEDDFEITTATLDQEDCGLNDTLLNNTDVLLWWGHVAHDRVPDELAKKIAERVHCGMGFIALHSAHFSKPFKTLMGGNCTLTWRDDAKEHLWTVLPSHPIAKNVPKVMTFPLEEMYGEPFGIPNPDEVVFMGWFSFGNVFRSGCTFRRGNGNIFYFQPGHETNPIYHREDVGQILRNAVRWAAPQVMLEKLDCPYEEHTMEEV